MQGDYQQSQTIATFIYLRCLTVPPGEYREISAASISDCIAEDFLHGTGHIAIFRIGISDDEHRRLDSGSR
jgi:hypothetical protein